MELPDAQLPVNFQFSQNNLQDFLVCPRRFQLKHLQQLSWPAIESEPVVEQELAIARGEQFHHIIHQCEVGVPANLLLDQINDSNVAGWFEAYLKYPPSNIPANHKSEFLLAAPFGQYRIIAKYDLLAFTPGHFVIVDWKTNSRRPRRIELSNRVQTRLYQYLLVRAGTYLNQNQPLNPSDISMMYWFTIDPKTPEIFNYSSTSYDEDEAWLSNLIHEIEDLSKRQVPFPMTMDEKYCKYCVYRSFCDRGIEAGSSIEDQELESEIKTDIDFEQIAEIEF